jgi:hypothetical protein
MSTQKALDGMVFCGQRQCGALQREVQAGNMTSG